jgi:hypothetical protein
MNDNQGRRHQMFVRVREYFAQRDADYSETSAVRQLFTELGEVITDLDRFAADQAAGIGQARQGTQTRGEARRQLREDLEAINRAARAMDLQSQFPLPERGNDITLLQSARAFAANALPLSARFIAHEMPDNFLANLNANIQALEAAIAAYGNAVGDHVEAGGTIDHLIDRGVEIVRKLKGIVLNKYENDPGALAEWASASHTERAPRRTVAVDSTPPPPSAKPPTE